MIRAWLSSHLVQLLVAALVGALALAGWQYLRAERAEKATADVRAEFASYRADAMAAAARAADDNARETARRLHVQSEVIHAEVQRFQQIQAGAARAAAAHDGLRGELARIAARGRAAAADPQAGPESQAAGSASAMLADLLDRCSARRRELAEFADRAHSAGLACQQSYDALTGGAATATATKADTSQ